MIEKVYIFLIDVRKERKKNSGKETIFKEIMAENFSKLMKDILQIQGGINPKEK